MPRDTGRHTMRVVAASRYGAWHWQPGNTALRGHICLEKQARLQSMSPHATRRRKASRYHVSISAAVHRMFYHIGLASARPCHKPGDECDVTPGTWTNPGLPFRVSLPALQLRRGYRARLPRPFDPQELARFHK